MERIYGNHRAVVTNINDTTKSGRVMIDIPALRLRNMWAEPAVAVGGSSGKGEYIIPRVGDKIFVFFDGGNVSYPIYFAMSPAQNDIPNAFSGKGTDPLIAYRNEHALVTPSWSEPTTNATVEYPYSQGIKFPGGVLLVVDESDGSKVAMYHPSNSYEEWQGDGNHIARASGSDYEIIIGSKFIYIGGSATQYIARSSDLVIGQNETKTVGGNGTSTYVGNNTINVGGALQANATSAGINAASISALFAGGSMTADAAGISMVLTTLLAITASALQLTANSVMSLNAGALISLVAPIVRLGMVGTVPVLVQGTSYCPYIGSPVTGGSTTVFGSP